jgi:hypothetical protein
MYRMYSAGKLRKFKKSRNEDNAQKLLATSQEPFKLLNFLMLSKTLLKLSVSFFV